MRRVRVQFLIPCIGMDNHVAPTRECAGMASWLALRACCGAILLCASVARADLPQRALVGNFVGYDALPENYLSISGSVDRTQNGESLYLEKTISPDSSFSLFAGYQRLE